MKQVTFIIAQSNGNKVELRIKSLPEGMTQDQFAGTYLFPALMRLIKGAGMVFDNELPVTLYFEAEGVDIQLIASVNIASKSVHAIRTAVLMFNEAIAGLVAPDKVLTIYQLKDMKGERGGEFRRYAQGLLRPSVPLALALEGAN